MYLLVFRGLGVGGCGVQGRLYTPFGWFVLAVIVFLQGAKSLARVNRPIRTRLPTYRTSCNINEVKWSYEKIMAFFFFFCRHSWVCHHVEWGDIIKPQYPSEDSSYIQTIISATSESGVSRCHSTSVELPRNRIVRHIAIDCSPLYQNHDISVIAFQIVVTPE